MNPSPRKFLFHKWNIISFPSLLEKSFILFSDDNVFHLFSSIEKKLMLSNREGTSILFHLEREIVILFHTKNEEIKSGFNSTGNICSIKLLIVV